MNRPLRSFAHALRPFALLLVLALSAAVAGATTITIVNNDGAGEGFNDPTPAAPVGGNPGTTLGQQRLDLFQHAADIWASILKSNVTIQVRAQFDPMTCDASSAVLGSASPTTIHRDFSGAPFTGTWYHQALANKLANTDMSLANPDINATFNSTLDLGTCLGGATWYYGYDGNEGTKVELLPVLLHEIGHGLGFSTTTSGSSGGYNSGFPGVWDHFLYSNTLNLHWTEMTAAQRAASAISVNGLVWDGAAANARASTWLSHRPQMVVNTPPGIAGTYTVQPAAFGPPLTSPGLTGDVVLLTDAGLTDPNDGCEAITNAAQLVGKIALINRGTCTFAFKVKAAQVAGAIAAIIVNNAATGLPPMGGSDPTVTIPSVGISQADGNALKANLASGVNVTLGLNAVFLAGADDAGRVRMYAPNPFEAGSSVSHFDVSLTPNALMEPAINGSLSRDTDLTPFLFQDIGWFTGSTAVDPRAVATATMLAAPRPNPALNGTSVTFRITRPEFVRLSVLDIRGARVRTLHEGMMLAGDHGATWDGRSDGARDVAPGVYLIALTTSQGTFTRRVSVIH